MTKLIPIHVIFQLPRVLVLGFQSASAWEIPGCPIGAYHWFNISSMEGDARISENLDSIIVR